MSSSTAQAQQADGRSNAGPRDSSLRANERAQQLINSDPKYKKYTQQVEKCLNAFDNVHEWADCISFLKQLLKTFQSYMQFKEIPHKLIVAKRLSQCLNPALPAGVHQRALDVYIHIMSVQGTEGLKYDLALWSSGLFPFFEYASTSVKPTLLNIYDTHYLPLQANLRPVMKSFILALLPGLEEETGEFFDKVMSLLDRLSGTVNPVFFIQNIWLIMLTMPSARGTSLNFLSRRLPRLQSNEDITQIVGRDVGLMFRAFAAALEDDNLLVRRSGLDLLLQCMRLDSAALKRVSQDDRVILMRAATGVVLRRDLSLNRRLYAWLLGADEKSDAQIAYLRGNGLDLLKDTLLTEMLLPSTEYSESRPFKVFISLLDKWEIGSPLTEVLVYDSLKALKSHMESSNDNKGDIVMTANSLYEAIDPSILWKHLLASIVNNVIGEEVSFEAIDMTIFVLRTFSDHEDDLRRIHLPVIFAAIVDAIRFDILQDQTRIARTAIAKAFMLLEELLHHLNPDGLLSRPNLTESQQDLVTTLSSLSYAYAFYGIEAPVQTSRNDETTLPLATVLCYTLSLSHLCAQGLLSQSGDSRYFRDVINRVLPFLAELVRLVSKAKVTAVKLSWDSSEWLSSILGVLHTADSDFVTVDNIVSVVILLHQTQQIQPKLNIDERATMSGMVKTLFRFLRQDYSIYHVRAVNLVWALEAATKQPHVESIISRSMTSLESRNVQDAYEAFGVLWRLTEDDVLPGVRLKVPMMIVLETLKNDSPSLRRVGETWMRCSLKSYSRVLDPLLHDLLDPSIRRSPHTFIVNDRKIQGYVYDRSFDQRYVNHLLEVLYAILQFGGQGFSKATRSTPIKRTYYEGLASRLTAGRFDMEGTYMDVIVDMLSRFLQSEPKMPHGQTMQLLNVSTHTSSVDILQAIVSRGDIDVLAVETIQPAVIGKLYACVHMKHFDMQNKLLHFLHSLISISVSRTVDEGHDSNGASQGSTSNYAVNPLLIHTITDGISIQSNRSLLQHWLDFVMMTVPQFQPALRVLVSPVIECLTRQLRVELVNIKAQGSSATTRVANDAEFTMLLNALERLVVLHMGAKDDMRSDEDAVVQEKPVHESGGLFGYVTTVFAAENPSSSEDQVGNRSPGFKYLYDGVRVLLALWRNLVWNDSQEWSPEKDSLALVYHRTRTRCRRAFEHFFHVQPVELLECVIDWWDREPLDPANPLEDDTVFELVDVLIANAQTAVHMLCECILSRTPSSSERGKRNVANPNLSDVILFRFLEQYLGRLEGPIALQVWGRFLSLTKEVASSTREFKMQFFLLLKCFSVLARKVMLTTASEDKRLKKDLQETYSRLLDSCVTFVGRTSDQTSWVRRPLKDALNNGRESPLPRIASDSRLNEKDNVNASSTSLTETKYIGWNSDLTSQICSFIAEVGLPNIRTFLVDNDKITNTCNNIVYYIVTPAVKAKAKPLDVDPMLIDILREMTKIPAALKVWRSSVADMLYDSRLFTSSHVLAKKWRPIVKVLFDTDKTAFSELMGKIVATPSSNIFTNRDQEMLLRAMNLRRLAFVLFAGEKNHYLTQLPTVQEKLVDVLRNVTSPLVQSEVFLCIRVLLCRLSPHNLTSFWPVVLTELYRVFDQALVNVPADGSEDLQLLLAVSKCLDILLTLQTEEFQVHQWIFITDTVDAVYRQDDWVPQGMLDQLSEAVGALPLPEAKQARPTSQLPDEEEPQAAIYPTYGDSRTARQPMLVKMRQIDSARDLLPFFSHVSIASYEGVYACGSNVDWSVVEEGILRDMFDSR